MSRPRSLCSIPANLIEELDAKAAQSNARVANGLRNLEGHVCSRAARKLERMSALLREISTNAKAWGVPADFVKRMRKEMTE